MQSDLVHSDGNGSDTHLHRLSALPSFLDSCASWAQGTERMLLEEACQSVPCRVQSPSFIRKVLQGRPLTHNRNSALVNTPSPLRDRDYHSIRLAASRTELGLDRP